MERMKPLNDYLFKRIFGEEESKDCLLSLLNAILSKKDRDKLVSLDIVENRELSRELIEDKTGILDVRARTSEGTQIDIEVQLTNQHNMEKRTLWYWGELFAEGIKKGEDYKNLKKVITINILDFEYIAIPNKFHTTFHFWEDEVKDYLLTDIAEIHFIEMEKFRKFKEKNLKDDKLQRWLTFFREDVSKEELEELMEMDSDIRKAEEKVEYLSSDPDTQELYKARERSLYDRANMLSSAKDEGIQEKAISVAKKMLLRGDSVSDVVEITELPEETILELKNQLQH